MWLVLGTNGFISKTLHKYLKSRPGLESGFSFLSQYLKKPNIILSIIISLTSFFPYITVLLVLPHSSSLLIVTFNITETRSH